MQPDLETVFFFGTFNPVHLGHLIMAQAVVAQCNTKRIIWVPAYKPPHRETDADLAPFHHRVNMLQRACQSNPQFHISTIESEREAPSYTVETLRQLRPDFEKNHLTLALIMGTDALHSLPQWYQAQVLMRHGFFLQTPRHNQPLITHVDSQNQLWPLHTQCITMPNIEISASQIRTQIKAGQSCRYMTPEPVLNYMVWNRLYQDR